MTAKSDCGREGRKALGIVVADQGKTTLGLQLEIRAYADPTPGARGVRCFLHTDDPAMQAVAEAAFLWVKGNYRDICRHLGCTDLPDAPAVRGEGGIVIEARPANVIKTGASLGVAMAVAIVSFFTGRPILHTVGMTGALKLSGELKHVGEVAEKAACFLKEGILRFVYPYGNDHVEVEKPMKLLPCRDMLEVIDKVIVPLGSKQERTSTYTVGYRRPSVVMFFGVTASPTLITYILVTMLLGLVRCCAFPSASLV